MTTRQDLSAWERREVGHLRGQGENTGFRALTAVAHTKRVFTHDVLCFLAALLIFLVAFNLIPLFARQVDPHGLPEEVGGVKLTIPFLVSRLLLSLIEWFGDHESS